MAYGAVGLSASALNVTSNVVFKLYCSLRSSKRLHDGSFAALMRSPLGFFELTPIGILNLFTRDIYVIDEVRVNAIGSFFRTVSAAPGVTGSQRLMHCTGHPGYWGLRGHSSGRSACLASCDPAWFPLQTCHEVSH